MGLSVLNGVANFILKGKCSRSIIHKNHANNYFLCLILIVLTLCSVPRSKTQRAGKPVPKQSLVKNGGVLRPRKNIPSLPAACDMYLIVFQAPLTHVQGGLLLGVGDGGRVVGYKTFFLPKKSLRFWRKWIGAHFH